jgi:hypothetical protein
MSKFLNLLNAVLNEQESDSESKSAEPVKMDDKISSALPEPEQVAMDSLKYKNLLNALREALYIAFKNDLEKQRVLSNIRIDSDNLEQLKNIENNLMSFLNQTESLPPTPE